MSKKIVLIGLILVFVLSSCVLPGGKAAKTTAPVVEPTIEQPAQPEEPVQPAEPAQPEPTVAAAEPVQPVQPVEQAKPKPTVAAAEPVQPVEQAKPEPTEAAVEPVAAAAEPTKEEPAPQEGFNFRDEFDLANDNFTEDLVTTTQAVTKDRMQTEPSTVQDGILVFNIRDNETYIYKFVKGSMTEDSIIEAKWKSNGQSMNGVALVCRASEDSSSWYEMRLSSQGEWQLLRYDQTIRDVDPFKNPYVTIKKGLAKNKLVRPSGDNVSKFSCIGSKLSYEVNGTKIVE
jgi:hypothetical protein